LEGYIEKYKVEKIPGIEVNLYGTVDLKVNNLFTDD